MIKSNRVKNHEGLTSRPLTLSLLYKYRIIYIPMKTYKDLIIFNYYYKSILSKKCVVPQY